MGYYTTIMVYRQGGETTDWQSNRESRESTPIYVLAEMAQRREMLGGSAGLRAFIPSPFGRGHGLFFSVWYRSGEEPRTPFPPSMNLV
jgi:hypothetical protein